jgi:hypothetical protein
VLAFGGGAQPRSGGSVEILRFGSSAGLGVVHLPALGGGVCLVDEGDVAGHVKAFGQLRGCALSTAKSVRMLREIGG